METQLSGLISIGGRGGTDRETDSSGTYHLSLLCFTAAEWSTAVYLSSQCLPRVMHITNSAHHGSGWMGEGEADVCATVNNVSRWEPGHRHVYFISILNSLADAGLYRFPGICKKSAEIATSLWSCFFFPPLFIYFIYLFALLLLGNVQRARSANPS